jgi:hypothetical protein
MLTLLYMQPIIQRHSLVNAIEKLICLDVVARSKTEIVARQLGVPHNRTRSNSTLRNEHLVTLSSQ